MHSVEIFGGVPDVVDSDLYFIGILPYLMVFYSTPIMLVDNVSTVQPSLILTFNGEIICIDF